MTELAFDLRDVCLSYRIPRRFRTPKVRRVFHNLSFSARHGESIGITGPNGAGKTTLLMLLAGTLKADSGHVANNCLHPALLTMNFGIEPSLPGRMNAVLHALYLGYRRREVLAKLPDIVAFAGLNEVINDPYYTYSTGMRARLAFSVVYHLDADLLLIDEILGVGDSEFKQRSNEALRRKIQERTCIIVSHNLQTLKEMCDRVYLLRDSVLQPV